MVELANRGAVVTRESGTAEDRTCRAVNGFMIGTE
jgi:hypothetical protein